MARDIDTSCISPKMTNTLRQGCAARSNEVNLDQPSPLSFFHRAISCNGPCDVVTEDIQSTSNDASFLPRFNRSVLYQPDSTSLLELSHNQSPFFPLRSTPPLHTLIFFTFFLFFHILLPPPYLLLISLPPYLLTSAVVANIVHNVLQTD
jgi:hypothetical protein